MTQWHLIISKLQVTQQCSITCGFAPKFAETILWSAKDDYTHARTYTSAQWRHCFQRRIQVYSASAFSTANGSSTAMTPQSLITTSFSGLSRLSVFVASTFRTTLWKIFDCISSVELFANKSPHWVVGNFAWRFDPRTQSNGRQWTLRKWVSLGIESSNTLSRIIRTLTIPSITFPKTTCRPSSHSVFLTVIKNCEPFVFFPAFAIDNHPAP